MMAFAVALGAAGCRNQNRGEAVGPAGGDTTMGGAETQPQAGAEQMQAYTVESIEGDSVRLRPEAVSGDVEAQAGREITITKDEFQRLAGSEAKEGTKVHVQLGDDGKPSKIKLQSGTMPESEEPGSETAPR